GNYHAPKQRTAQPPAYPKWLKKHLTRKLNVAGHDADHTPSQHSQASDLTTHPSFFESLLIDKLPPHSA
ncbi:hypothetical protein CVV68_17925, partial [Arthrobacter livingstonensis]